jgi:hypothetical protein
VRRITRKKKPPSAVVAVMENIAIENTVVKMRSSAKLVCFHGSIMIVFYEINAQMDDLRK